MSIFTVSLCSSAVYSVMFEAKHKHSALYKIHYTIYRCPFCNKFIRSHHKNFPFPNNRKGPSSFQKHPYWLWGLSSLPCDGEMGAIFLQIKQLQHEAAVLVLKSTMSAAVALLPAQASWCTWGQLQHSLSIRTARQHLRAPHPSTPSHTVIYFVLPIHPVIHNTSQHSATDGLNPCIITEQYAVFCRLRFTSFIQWRYSPTGSWPTERPPPVSEASANFCG